MNDSTQRDKAQRFRQLHHEPEILVLPNIWDALGARLLVQLGYPAVATASASIAFSHGVDDGEKISFATLLEAVGHIARAVDVPVTVDLERGYAETLPELQENIKALLHCGAVGINLEDSLEEGRALRAIDAQCERIQAVRTAADKVEIPLFINARTDVFLNAELERSAQLTQALERGAAYRDAGADSLYPIGLADLGDLRRLQTETTLALNVYASANAPEASTLEKAGIARLSAGPGMLRAAFSTMQTVAREFLDTGRSALVHQSVKSDEIRQYLKQD